MKATSKLIGRIAMLAVAVALLLGVAGRSASAQTIDINSGPATIARALCYASGGDWNITNGIFFCTTPDGGGWACDMNTNPIVCWNRPPQAQVVKGALGNVQAHPTSSPTGPAAAVQAQIAKTLPVPTAAGAPGVKTAGTVSQTATVKVASASAP